MGVPRLQVDDAAEAVIDAYRIHELEARGLSEWTVTNACYALRQFLAWRAVAGRPSLVHLDAGELHDYVCHEAERLRIGAMRSTVGMLRTFTRFLFATGVTGTDLAGSVPSVAGPRFDGLPKALDPATVEILLGSCALARPTGRRDYAILLLMARLGLRAVEVARLPARRHRLASRGDRGLGQTRPPGPSAAAGGRRQSHRRLPAPGPSLDGVSLGVPSGVRFAGGHVPQRRRVRVAHRF